MTWTAAHLVRCPLRPSRGKQDGLFLGGLALLAVLGLGLGVLLLLLALLGLEVVLVARG